MSDFRQRLKSALEKAVASADIETREDIEALLKMFRSRADRQIATMREKNPELAKRATRILDETLVEFHMTAMNPPGNSPVNTDGQERLTNEGMNDDTFSQDKQRARLLIVPFAAGFLVALGIMALLTLLANRSGYLSDFSVFQTKDEESFAIPSEDVVLARAMTSDLVDIAGRVESRIEEDPVSKIIGPSNGFVQLREAFPDIWEDAPLTIKGTVGMILRKDGEAYKIVFTNRICPIAISASNFKRDMRREPEGFLALCSHFGVWNEGGKDF